MTENKLRAASKPAWVSGKEAIEHIMKATGCDREEAQRLLLRKVAGGKVSAVDKQGNPWTPLKGVKMKEPRPPAGGKG